MKKVYFATTNKGKVESVSNALSKYAITVVHVDLDMPEPRSDDLREIAKQKVLYAFNNIKKPCIVLDAGFYIWSLNGFPRSFTNFALETLGIEGILKLLRGKARECQFRGCLAYFDKTLKEPVYFEYEVNGKIVTSPRGKLKPYSWSRLHLVFTPDGETKTLAEMPKKEYQQWRLTHDHAVYLKQFAEWLIQKQKTKP